MLIKTKEIKRKKLIMICQSEVFIVCGHTALGNCITLVNRFSNERTRVGMCTSFY